MRSVYTVKGTIAGLGWWPRVTLCHTFTYRYERQVGEDCRPSLQQLVSGVFAAEDGDFECGIVLLADTILTIRRDHRSRSFPLTRFPSLADIASVEWPEAVEA